jgi:hypothetical protein
LCSALPLKIAAVVCRGSDAGTMTTPAIYPCRRRPSLGSAFLIRWLQGWTDTDGIPPTADGHMSFRAKLQQAKVQLAQADAERDADPLLPLVRAAVTPFDALSTTAILTMVGLRPTTGNARKVARSMRTLGYVGIKSRRLPPGGWSDTLCRGWAKSPCREKNRTTLLCATLKISESHIPVAPDPIRGINEHRRALAWGRCKRFSDAWTWRPSALGISRT